MKTKTMRYVGLYLKYILKSSKSQVCPSLSAGIHINSLDQGTSKFYNPTCDNGVEHCRRSWRKVSTRHMTRCCWRQWRGMIFSTAAVVLWGDKDGCSVTWRIIPVRISGQQPWWICTLSRVVGPLPNGVNGYWDDHPVMFSLEVPTCSNMAHEFLSAGHHSCAGYHINSVDGRNPAPVEVGSLSDDLQGFIHPRWLFGISEPSTVW